MYLIKCIVNGFYSHLNSEITLDENKSNIIVGTNGSGKSLFFECVYNVIESLNNKQINIYENLNNVISNEPYIKIEIDFNDEEKKIFNMILFLMCIHSNFYCKYNEKHYNEIYKYINNNNIFEKGIDLIYTKKIIIITHL
jgi:predicted ATP-binding protein involved in virulence